MCVYIYIYIYIYRCVYIYIYILFATRCPGRLAGRFAGRVAAFKASGCKLKLTYADYHYYYYYYLYHYYHYYYYYYHYHYYHYYFIHALEGLRGGLIQQQYFIKLLVHAWICFVQSYNSPLSSTSAQVKVLESLHLRGACGAVRRTFTLRKSKCFKQNHIIFERHSLRTGGGRGRRHQRRIN